MNNAGITRDTLAMRMSSEDWDLVLQTNLKGAFNFTRAVLRAMTEQQQRRPGGSSDPWSWQWRSAVALLHHALLPESAPARPFPR